jgi:hypothetical protein
VSAIEEPNGKDLGFGGLLNGYLLMLKYEYGDGCSVPCDQVGIHPRALEFSVVSFSGLSTLLNLRDGLSDGHSEA